MIRLDSPADYPKLDNVHPLIRQHLKNYINSFLSDYDTSDLSEIGCVFLMQEKIDLDAHQAIGLSQPLKKSLNEFTEVLILKGIADTVRLIHTVFILTDSWGIDLFMLEALPDEALKRHLFEEYTGERVIELEEC